MKASQLKRLKALESDQSGIIYPEFSMFFSTESEHRAWFEATNPRRNVDAYMRTLKTFKDMYK